MRASPRPGTWSRRQGTRHSQSLLGLLERLIHTKVGDLKPQWIDAHELVRHVLTDDEIDLRDEGLARPLVTRSRRVQHLLKAHRRLVGWLRKLTQAHVLDDDVHLVGRGIRQKGLENTTLIVVGDGGV